MILMGDPRSGLHFFWAAIFGFGKSVFRPPMLFVCRRCNVQKSRDLDNFAADPRKRDGLVSTCRKCVSAKALDRYYANRSAALARRSAYRRRIAEGNHQPKERQGYSAGDRSRAIEAERRSRSKSVVQKLNKRVRRRVEKALSRSVGNITELLGCTPADLVEHLEAQFQPGMTWENRGEWHIDHIRPLASFDLTDPEQVRAASHYTNLQPLWAADNQAKGARLDWAA